jgi:hypothetical protein
MWRLAPNSSPSKARFNPDEPNLQLSESSIPKASSLPVGVEASLEVLPMLQKSSFQSEAESSMI